jgi:hypothetical protein
MENLQELQYTASDGSHWLMVLVLIHPTLESLIKYGYPAW